MIKSGDIKADYAYIVQEGQFEVSRPDDLEDSAATQKMTTVRSRQLLGRGDCFGELALLYSSPRSATVKAVSKSVVWVAPQICHF